MKRFLVNLMLYILALMVYLQGFLQLSNIRTKEVGDPKTQLVKLPDHWNEPPVAKTVLLIIDGLRTDHLVNSPMPYMNFSRHLIENGRGIGYLLKTETPTVTLPRIKSIITGTIPEFMDVILNFVSEKFKESNLVELWKEKGYKINFFGDDTWLNLFPSTFHVSKGVTSFFVSDYEKVDNTVTDELNINLFYNEWDVMILHYLGLDHIGHLEGPKSKAIRPKLAEMDMIIEKIYVELQRKNEPYVFLICGDHGMSDAGGHGGASSSEIMTSALFVSNLFKGTSSKNSLQVVHQVDLASTLAGLTGIGVPSGNIGQPLSELLDVLTLKKQIAVHEKTAYQLINNALDFTDHGLSEDLLNLRGRVIKSLEKLIVKCTEDQCSIDRAEGYRLLEMYRLVERRATEILKGNLHTFHPGVVFGSLMAILLIGVANFFFATIKQSVVRQVIALDWFILLFATCSFMFGMNRAFPIVCLVVYGIIETVRAMEVPAGGLEIQVPRGNTVQKFISLSLVAYPLSLFGTSFVEEEHQTLYFIISTLHFLLFVGLLKKVLEAVQHPGTKLIKVPNQMQQEPQLEWMVNKLVGRCGSYCISYYVVLALQLMCSWVLFSLMRHFNSTGDKWRHLVDWNDILLTMSVSTQLACIVAGVCLTISLYLKYHYGLVGVGVLCVVRHLIPFNGTYITESSDVIMQLTYSCLLALALATAYKFKKYLTQWRIGQFCNVNAYPMELSYGFVEMLIVALLLTLQRPENVLLTAFGVLQGRLFISFLMKASRSLNIPLSYCAVMVFWLANAHFFMHGNSNSLTTVQLNSGFMGISFYMPVVHGFLIAVHTFGPKIWVMLHFIRCVLQHTLKSTNVKLCLVYWYRMQMLSLCLYSLVVAAQRLHLFIWTVFTPKLLYEGCHMLCIAGLAAITFPCAIYLDAKFGNNELPN